MTKRVEQIYIYLFLLQKDADFIVTRFILKLSAGCPCFLSVLDCGGWLMIRLLEAGVSLERVL